MFTYQDVGKALKNDYLNDEAQFKHGSVTCTIYCYEKIAFITWTGTEDLLDWLRNFRGIPWCDKEYGTGWWVSGYLKGVKALVPQVNKCLFELYRDGYKIVVIGHSKGGAEATIYTTLLKACGVVANALITCGASASAFGKKDLEGVFQKRFVHDDDIVPKLRPWLTHTCEATILEPGDDGIVEISIADHFLDSYITFMPNEPLEI